MESRVVIVTGGATGLGRAMALALLGAGHCVAIVSRTATALDAMRAVVAANGAGDRILTIVGSVREAADCAHAVRATIERFGRVDGLVNNAGAHLSTEEPPPRFFELSEEQWRAIVETHLFGAFLMTRALMPQLLALGWGRIINHETSYTTMVRARFSAYGAAKAGLEAATVAWSEELRGTGVTVNAILPGGAANVSRISSRLFRDRAQLVQPEQMGPPIVWLMSDASSDVTGCRVTAADWNPAATEAGNRAAAVTAAGWSTPAYSRP